jgi:hypothetical protein
LHLFSASPELVAFGSRTYQRRSADTSALLVQLFEKFRVEGLAMSYTMEDFRRQFAKEHFGELTPQEQREALQRLSPDALREFLQAMSPEELLAGLSEEQVRRLSEQLATGRPGQPRKSRRKR